MTRPDLTDPALLRTMIRDALDSMEQPLFDGLAMVAGLEGVGDAFERVAREELDRSSHDVQVYWLGPCNCHGALN